MQSDIVILKALAGVSSLPSFVSPFPHPLLIYNSVMDEAVLCRAIGSQALSAAFFPTRQTKLSIAFDLLYAFGGNLTSGVDYL